MIKKFETDLQEMKYKILKEISKLKFDDKLEEEYHNISQKIISGTRAKFRCCVYKERAIIDERIKTVIGHGKKVNGVIEVIDIACDECPINRYVVTESCRGCLAHYCNNACPVGAIYYVDHKAYINQEKCIECGKCKKACPYDAISEVMRPCRRACKVEAINMDENKVATIDYDKCISCGACVYKCPFGAITDKSEIVEVIDALVNKKSNTYALIAPAISSQFTPAKIGQVVHAIKELGFKDVIEVALGADMIAKIESEEFIDTIEERNIMTTSCCPAFVELIYKHYPELKDKISSTVSPMIAIGRFIKKIHPTSKVVFFGPCTAKKMEAKKDDLKDAVDYVLSFEELQALIGAKDIDIDKCNEEPLNNASFFGRIFARSGGVTETMEKMIEENSKIKFNPVKCEGITECKKNLKLMSVNRLNSNFLEGMACMNGCIGGPVSLTHIPKDRKEVDKYANLAMEKTIADSLEVLDITGIKFHRKHK